MNPNDIQFALCLVGTAVCGAKAATATDRPTAQRALIASLLFVVLAKLATMPTTSSMSAMP